MSKEWTPDTIFDLLGDEVARQILEHTSVEPTSADALADRIGVSRPTIYRRLDALEGFQLLEAGVRMDDDGNHVKRFVTNLSEISLSLVDGGWRVDVETDTDLAAKFSEFWRDLEVGVDVDSDDVRSSDSVTGVGNSSGR